MAKALLWFNSIGFVGFGILGLVSPEFVSSLVGYELLREDAVIEIRAQYGGLFLAIGGFGLLAVLRPTLESVGLLFMCFIYAGLAGGRVLGLILDGSAGSYTIGAVAFEVVMTILLLLTQVQSRKEEPPV